MTIDFSKANLIGQSLISSWLPDGKKVGNEWICKNPTRRDGKPGSFKINLKSGIWKDFSTGDAGSDPVSLYAYLNGIGQAESARKILDQNEIPIETKKRKETVWTPIVPVPDSATDPDFEHFELGKPDRIFPYHDPYGKLLFYVLRFETESGKDLRPMSYAKSDDGRYRWIWKRPNFESGIPLYGINELAGSGKRPVVIVEGEKKRDALRKFVGKNAVILSLCNGSNSVDKMDWSPLKNKSKILIWRDNDEAGLKAAEKIKEHLPNAKILEIPDGKPHGWDCDDAIEEKEDVFKILGIRPKIQSEKPRYRVLGYDHGHYFFLSGRSRQVVSYSASGLSTNALLSLADLSYWEEAYPKDKGDFNLTQAVNTIIGQADKIGAYDPGRIRGRGVWLDDGRIVQHLGDRLRVGDEVIHDLAGFESDFIYESRPKISGNDSAALTVENGRKLVDIFRSLNWENKIYADYLAGWCMVATVSGALNWRPHVWILGAPGSGKSWVIENIVSKLLGKSTVYGLGNSTADGLRQEIGGEALPVIIDESESKNQQQAEKIQNYLFLARQSSSESGGKIFRGSQSGRSQSFAIRSCWLFSSTISASTDQADNTRITDLTLSVNKSEDSTEKFKKIRNSVFDILTEGFCDSYRSRAVKMLPIIRENIEVTSTVMAKVFNSQRLGDQTGTLLAGFFASVHDKPVTEEYVYSYISRHTFDETVQISEIKDEENCLATITGHIMRLDGGVTATIQELIAMLIGRPTTISVTGSDCDTYLRRIGIRVISDKIYIQNGHPEIKKILEKTAYSSNYNQVLKRVDGAKPSEKQRILTGQKPVRCTEIPVSAIFDDFLS